MHNWPNARKVRRWRVSRKGHVPKWKQRRVSFYVYGPVHTESSNSMAHRKGKKFLPEEPFNDLWFIKICDIVYDTTKDFSPIQSIWDSVGITMNYTWVKTTAESYSSIGVENNNDLCTFSMYCNCPDTKCINSRLSIGEIASEKTIITAAEIQLPIQLPYFSRCDNCLFRYHFRHRFCT